MARQHSTRFLQPGSFGTFIDAIIENPAFLPVQDQQSSVLPWPITAIFSVSEFHVPIS
jgi:hypothetical protein